MTQTSQPVSLNGSRLVRFISDLALADVSLSHSQLVERLGQLIDLPDAISLSSTHGKLGAKAFKEAIFTPTEINAQFLSERSSLVQSIIRSFVPDSTSTRLKLPVVKAEIPALKEKAYEPYLRFYGAHQREMDARVKTLQLETRSAAACISPELAQLCALDSALGDTLLIHARKIFAVIPKLLAKRFAFLLEEYRQELGRSPDDHTLWKQMLERFGSEIQALLLAEIEIRLQPTLGLIEAINEHADKIND